MEFTVLEIATFLKGEVVGDPALKVNCVSKIEEGKPGSLSFLSNLKYEPHLYDTQASAVLVNADFFPEKEVNVTLIKVKDAYTAMSSLLDLYMQSIPQKKGIESPVYLAPTATYGDEVYLGAFCYLGENVRVGNNVKIYPHVWIGDGSVIGDNTTVFAGVKIYPETLIGKNCIFHAGAVIGSDGFGFAPQPDGTYKKIYQIGNVVIEDDVEIGANTTIDCATMGSTRIKKGVKLDNLVQIAHNVVVGENTVMAAQTGIAGSTSIGSNCVFGGQGGAAGHLKIGNHVTLGGKTGASNDVPDGKILMGEWGMDASRYRRVYAVFRNLPELFQEVNHLKKELKKINAE
ncbi:MAG TPA: UDP-3-O-(3-hydroxymyristoyl)glucosamine N-acyltransferase [Prolixibacteraceae bacterium]|nr:UDP-3-O-(3-hydroxymyristoyl)glucosamine N-acyltransferase [Prolixibacteraceae bacterium]HPS12195.1 UDP-3-O-(3-hydroxymyristoyl)glucosamine N-acyltransferase [Prolixibacteraceae bacterium]